MSRRRRESHHSACTRMTSGDWALAKHSKSSAAYWSGRRTPRKCFSLQGHQRPVGMKPTPRRFCSFHRTPSKDDKEVWLLQRDITYALILPVIEIYRYASQLARSMLGNRNIFDLELVFRGEARGAFSWLQCFIVEEKDWCSTRGCPG